MNFSKTEFSGKRILITGATGSFGRATVSRLAEAGAELVLSARDTVKLEELAASLPGKHSIAPFELTNTDGIVDWLRGLAEKDGPLSGVVHTAGVCVIRPLKLLNSEFINKMLIMNVTSSIMLGKAFRQKACHTDGASMVLVSSIASFTFGGGNVTYAASKGAVTAAAKSMAHELLRDKIRVNCIVPAVVESDMAARSQRSMPADSWQAIVNRHPLGLGKPIDIAHAIAFLLSESSQWITGTELLIDGGLSII